MVTSIVNDKQSCDVSDRCSCWSLPPKTLVSVNVQHDQPLVCVTATGTNWPRWRSAFITSNNPASCLNSLSKYKGCIFFYYITLESQRIPRSSFAENHKDARWVKGTTEIMDEFKETGSLWTRCSLCTWPYKIRPVETIHILNAFMNGTFRN